MFSRFSRRGLCFLLALVTLCMCLSPALTQPAEAVAAGVVAGTVAIGATAVVAAMLSGLGVKPGSDASAWDKRSTSSRSKKVLSASVTVSSSFRTASFRKSRPSRTLLHRALLIARTGFRGLGKAWPLPWMLWEQSSLPAFNPALIRCVSSPLRPSPLKWQMLGSGSRACRRRWPRHSKRFSRNRKTWVQHIRRTGRLSSLSVSPST